MNNEIQSDFLEIKLSIDEANAIKNGFASIKYDPMGQDSYISALRITAYQYMPERLLRILEQQKSTRKLLPYFTIDNLPIDEEISGSPNFFETGAMYKSGDLSEKLICAIGSIIGEPYSIYFEGRELVNNITPQKATVQDYTGLGAVELDLHIENAALKYMSEDDCSPRGMLFLGIRKDNSGPKNFFADSRQAVKLLSQEALEILYGNHFIIRLPHRWRNAFVQKTDNSELCPLISGPIEWPRLSAVFYSDMVLPVNSRAKEALDQLHQAMKSIAIEIDITPGKLVYVDNRFALHSREKFIPSYDENNRPYRWLQRLSITSNLWNFRQFPSVNCDDGRVFNPSLPGKVIGENNHAKH